MTKERPILFSAPMVRALLLGTKTQTRRIVKEPGWATPSTVHLFNNWPWADDPLKGDRDVPCPYGQPGDRLWVREAWGDCTKGADIMGGTHYDGPLFQADADAYGLLGHDGLGPVYAEEIKWRSAIYMPRKLSRITLEVTGVRVERVQDINDDDVFAEGVNRIAHGREGYFYHAIRNEPHARNFCFPDAAYRDLWEQINGPGSWEANPWVWVVEFKRVTP